VSDKDYKCSGRLEEKIHARQGLEYIQWDKIVSLFWPFFEKVDVFEN
jgi:hypothetical protein